jgi:hypothetical protein
MLTGVIDGNRGGGLPKAIELYSRCDISDLSLFGLGIASNGAGSGGLEYNFPPDAISAGSFIYVSKVSVEFQSFFGFAPTYSRTNVANFNGDDALELYSGAAVVDQFGEVSGDALDGGWFYQDGWAYRQSGVDPGHGFRLCEWMVGNSQVWTRTRRIKKQGLLGLPFQTAPTIPTCKQLFAVSVCICLA